MKNQSFNQIRDKSIGLADHVVNSNRFTEGELINTCFFFLIFRRYGMLQQAPNASTASHVTEQLPIWHQVAAAEKSMYCPSERAKFSQN